MVLNKGDSLYIVEVEALEGYANLVSPSSIKRWTKNPNNLKYTLGEISEG